MINCSTPEVHNESRALYLPTKNGSRSFCNTGCNGPLIPILIILNASKQYCHYGRHCYPILMLSFELDTLLHSPKPFVGHHFWIHLPYLLPRNFQFNFGMGHHHRRRTLSALVRTDRFLPSCLPTLLFTSSFLAVDIQFGRLCGHVSEHPHYQFL